MMLGAAVGGLCHGGAAFAQDADDIVVTARRVEERLQDVPISITVFSQEQLANRNIVTSGDLATYTPSLSVNNRYGPEKATFTLRGFNQDTATSPSVGVYFADVIGARANSGIPSGNGSGVGMFFDLQNVQVLKGPQGTLFGRNTTGGAILLVPQKPTSRLEGFVEGTIGNFDQRRLQAVLNIPVNDTFRVRLGIDRNKRDGFLINKSGIGPRDFADTNYIAVRASIVADLTPNLENYTIVSYSKSNARPYPARVVACDRTRFNTTLTALAACNQLDRQNARGDGPYDIENNVPNPSQQLENWQVVNTTTWQASDTLTIKNIASYAEFRDNPNFNNFGDNFSMPAFSPGSLGANLATVPAGTPFNYVTLTSRPGGYLVSQYTATEELQFQGRTTDGRLTWQLGGYLELSGPVNGFNGGYNTVFMACTDIKALACQPVFGAAGSVSLSLIRTHYNNKGFYGQATYKLTDQLSVTGGIRYTIDHEQLDSRYTRLRFFTPTSPVLVCNDTVRLFTGKPGTPLVVTSPSQCQETFKTSSKKPTWLIDVDYKPIDDMLLYAKYARGYRQGGINPLNVGLETWAPESLDSYEVGAKFSFSGALRGYFNVAGFWNDLTNQQVQANAIAKAGSGAAGGNVIVNIGKSRIAGIEVEASVTPITGFKLDLGYTYLDTKLVAQTAPTLPAESVYSSIVPRGTIGGVLNLSPKNRVTLTGTYSLPLDSSIGDVSIGATFTHTDRQQVDATSILGVLPATDLLNVNLNWNNIGDKPIDLALFATNVTKKVYPVGVGSGWAASGFETLIMGQPRIFGARVKWRFGN